MFKLDNFFFFGCIFILFLFQIGVITMLESKILSYIQNSSGPIKTYYGICQFVLDFIKLGGKDVFSGSGGLFLCLVLMFSYFLLYKGLPLSLLTSEKEYGLIILFLLFKLISLLKGGVLSMVLWDSMSGIFFYRWSLIVFIKELLGMISFIWIYGILSVLGLISWLDLHNWLTVNFLFFFIMLLFFVFVELLLITFSSPFDFLELDSEVSGGLMMGFGGWGYVLWSIVEYCSILTSIWFYSFFFFGVLKSWILFFCLWYVFSLGFLFSSGFLMSFDVLSILSIFCSEMCFIIMFFLILICFFLLLVLLNFWLTLQYSSEEMRVTENSFSVS